MRLIYLSVFAVISCASPEVQTASTAAVAPWTLENTRADLEIASCPAKTARLDFTAIELNVIPVPLGPDSRTAGALGAGVTYAGGWQLQSDLSTFGGLSGLAILADGDLLAVSDAGAFVGVTLDSGAPIGASIGYMRSADGTLLDGKRGGDAEGLALSGTLALVSFEQDHRVLAFNIGACGAAAAGVPVAQLSNRVDGKTIAPNNGAEALWLDPADGSLRYTYERPSDGQRADGTVFTDASGQPDAATDRLDGAEGYSSVGHDAVTLPSGKSVEAHLFRSYDPVRGNRTIIRMGGDSTDREIRLARPLTVDNFEGITLQPLGSGAVRVWIVSDDNFSNRQRTLLMAFDVAEP